MGDPTEEVEELRKTAFSGLLTGTTSPTIPDVQQFSTYQELLEATAQLLHGAADSTTQSAANDYSKAKLALLRHAQMESFPEEFTLIKSGKTILTSSRLLTLAPEYNESSDLIRVGGGLRRCNSLSQEVLHPTSF